MSRRTSKPPVAPAMPAALVQPGTSADTVELLEALLLEARRGDLTGLVAITFERPGSKRKYFLTRSGVAAANPTLAVGAVSATLVLLNELALEDAGLVP